MEDAADESDNEYCIDDRARQDALSILRFTEFPRDQLIRCSGANGEAQRPRPPLRTKSREWQGAGREGERESRDREGRLQSD
jgi:hypothetical protein